MRRASKVLTLNQSVPPSCTTAARRSTPARFQVRGRRHPSSPEAGSPTACAYCRPAAAVKKIEPTKNTAASSPPGTIEDSPGNAAPAKHADPTMNRTATHHVGSRLRAACALSGTRWRRSAELLRELGDDDAACRLDQGEVREGLREVAQMTRVVDVELF